MHAFETLRVQRAPTQRPTPPTLRSACLAMTIGKSSTSTAVWTGTTPLVIAIIDTEPTSSGPLRVTTYTAHAKTRNPTTAPPWHTAPGWWFKTSSHPTDGCLQTWMLCCGSPPHTGALSTQIRGATTPRPTPNERADSTPMLEPSPGRWPSLLRATAGKVSSNPPTGETSSPSVRAPNRSMQNAGVPLPTGPPKRVRTVFSCSPPGPTFSPLAPMGFGTRTTKIFVPRPEAAWQHRTLQAPLRSYSSSTRTDGSPTKTTC